MLLLLLLLLERSTLVRRIKRGGRRKRVRWMDERECAVYVVVVFVVVWKPV